MYRRSLSRIVKLQIVPFSFLKLDMNKFHGELTQRERELLKIRRDSDTKAAELVKMEKMLQQTKNLLDKKTESGSESMTYQENMGLYHKGNTNFILSFILLLVVVVSDCLFSGRLLQWRTWRKEFAPADDTGGTPSITHRCWRAR